MGRKQKPKRRQESQATGSEQNGSRKGASNTPVNADARFVSWLAVGGIVVAALCLLLFFQSDVREKIVASNIAAAQAEAAREAANRPSDGRDGRDGRDGTDGLPGDSAPGDISDEPGDSDTDGSTPDDTGVDGAPNGDGQDGSAPDSVETPSSDIVIAPGAVIDREALTGYLSEMDRDDFIELAESVDLLIADDPSRINLPERKSLAEAYAEAEALYPGQIDASKRLKLIAEINAIDYLYYIAEDGDTLLELSNAFNVPLGQLVEINGIKDADVIPAGMVILFPSDTKQ